MPPQQHSEKLVGPESPTKPDVYTAIIVDEIGRILISTRPKDRDYPEQPALISGIGSSKKKGLSGITAARDEVNADLGTTTFQGQEIFKRRLSRSEKAGNNIVYVGSINKKDIILNNKLSVGFNWYSLKDALQLDLAFDHKEILLTYQEYLKEKSDSQTFYTKVKEGIPEGVTDREFIDSTASEIAKISASQLSLELGLDSKQIEFYLQYIKDQYLGQLIGNYTLDGKIDLRHEAAVKAIVTKLPKAFDQAYLPQLAEVIGLRSYDSSTNIPRITLFSTIIDYCRNKVPALDQYLKYPTKEEVITTVSSRVDDNEYRAQITNELAKHFPDSGGRELNYHELEYMKLSLHLANFIWQIAKLPQYCLEHNEYKAGIRRGDSKRLKNWQYFEFPKMMAKAYAEYSQDPQLKSNPKSILIMVAFKLFQDLNEFCQ